MDIHTVLGYLMMLGHSLIFKKKIETIYTFLGGLIIAFLMEYTLSIVLKAYDYQYLPISILGIPLVIPLGWVVTYYGLYSLSDSWIGNKNPYLIVILSGVIAFFFGIGIENLARILNYWDFHFETVLFFGIPIIVSLAWCLSIMNFTAGSILVKKFPKLALLILAIIHLLNMGVSIFLLRFTDIN